MAAFLGRWFFDWLSITIPNGLDGRGTRRGVDPKVETKARAIKDEAERRAALAALKVEVAAGEAEADAASDHLCQWAATAGLFHTKIGRAPDGYEGGMNYGASPVNKEVLAMVRAGHKMNMPGLVLPGADGACAGLALDALDRLGPVLLARADVSLDHSRAGYFDELLEYARKISEEAGRAAPRLIESDTGRTFYWGSGKASVKVYQKDLERVAKGKLDADDADPDLVRIEFCIRPAVDDKAGMAALAAEEGPGALLATVHWVRDMVEFIAELIGAAEQGETGLAVGRIDRTPAPRSVRDRAEYMMDRAARSICEAAADEIVRRDFGGDWLAAEVFPEEIQAGALEMVKEWLFHSDAPAKAASRLGLDRARDTNEEAARAKADLVGYMDRQREAARVAQQKLIVSARSAAA